MTRRWIIVGGLVLALAAAAPAFAQMMGSGSGTAGMMGMMGATGTMPMAGMMSGGHGAAMDGCPGMGAQPAAADPERPWIGFALTHAKDLGLTDEQVAQLGALRDDFVKEAGGLAQDIRAGEAALTQLYAQKPLHLPAIEAKIRTIAGREADVRVLRLKTLQKAAPLLTEEQRQKLADPSWRIGRMMGASAPAATF